MTREQKIDKLVFNDIADIMQSYQDDDLEFLDRVLRGDGWKPYNQLSDSEIDQEYASREFPEGDE